MLLPQKSAVKFCWYSEDACWVTEAWVLAGAVSNGCPETCRKQAVNIPQLVLAEHPQGWAANRASLGQMREFSSPVRSQLPPTSTPSAALSAPQWETNPLDYPSPPLPCKTWCMFTVYLNAGVLRVILCINAFMMTLWSDICSLKGYCSYLDSFIKLGRSKDLQLEVQTEIEPQGLTNESIGCLLLS